MFYRIVRSIRAHPNAWLFALGLAIAILPIAAWYVVTAAEKTVNGWWEDGPALGAIIKHFTGREGYPQEEMQGPFSDSVRAYSKLMKTKPYIYSMVVGWLVGPVLMVAAIFRRLSVRLSLPAA